MCASLCSRKRTPSILALCFCLCVVKRENKRKVRNRLGRQVSHYADIQAYVSFPFQTFPFFTSIPMFSNTSVVICTSSVLIFLNAPKLSV